MSDLVTVLLNTIIPALLISIIASYVTVQLSLKQFYSQRKWDKKAEAYFQILEHLSYLQYYYGEWIDDFRFDLNISEDRKKKLLEGYLKSKEAITKASALGELVISASATKSMSELLHELFNQRLNSNPDEAVDKSYGAVVECIKTIREEAKKTLWR